MTKKSWINIDFVIFQVTLGYFIMLAAMSYNTWVFISIIAGMSLGNWAFGWTVKGNFSQICMSPRVGSFLPESFK